MNRLASPKQFQFAASRFCQQTKQKPYDSPLVTPGDFTASATISWPHLATEARAETMPKLH